MTEAQWLVSDDPRAMLDFIDPPTLHPDPLQRRPRLRMLELRLLCDFVLACRKLVDGREGRGRLEWASLIDVAEAQTVIDFWVTGQGYQTHLPMAERADLLREFVGHSPRPLPSCAAWRTPDVLSLTGAADAHRLRGGLPDPVRLAILSDALEDADCDDPDLLGHLRGQMRCAACLPRRRADAGSPGCVACGATGWRPLRVPHQQGCWALGCLLVEPPPPAKVLS